MMIDGIPDRPLYFYQKDIIGSEGAPVVRFVSRSVGAVLTIMI